jgi:hypothetical protein
MISYRFSDKGKIFSKTDYIIFINSNFIEIDFHIYNKGKILISTSAEFKIDNSSINWNERLIEFISDECKEYCNKLIKLKAFT